MNLTSLLIRALQASPESYFIPSIVPHLDENGNYIGEKQYESWYIATLNDIILHGKEYEEKYHRLAGMVEEELSETEMEDLKRLGGLVGRCGYTELNSLHRFIK